MWAIAMRRLKKLDFEPVPQPFVTKKEAFVIENWELLDKRIERCTKGNVSSAGRLRAQGLGDTWDMILNDFIDLEIEKLRAQYPKFDRLVKAAEAEARRINAVKACEAQRAFGITKREVGVKRLQQIADRKGQIAESMTIELIEQTENAWMRAAAGKQNPGDQAYLTDAFVARVAAEIRRTGTSLGVYTLCVLGRQLWPDYFDGLSEAHEEPSLGVQERIEK
jgi:hypothetical protein